MATRTASTTAAATTNVPFTPPPEVPVGNAGNIPPAPTIRGTQIPTGIVFYGTYDVVSGFAAYGSKLVKPLYVTKELGLDRDKARTILHSLSTLGYFLPVIGAFIVDSWIGKYKAISRFMVISVLVHIFFFLSTVPPLHMNPRIIFLIISSLLGSLVGMFTGAAHPGFGGDQFVEGQEKQRSRYYSSIYFVFNGLAMAALFIFPTLRDTPCFGGQFCYSLAFGVSCAIYTVSLILLFCGRPFYRIVPPSGTVMKNFFLCIWIALREKYRNRSAKRDHWLDHAEVRFSPEFINNVKAIFGLLVLFVPIPVYNCLYEQMNTSWTYQSDVLDGRQIGGYELLPDTMDFFNTFLVLIFIPLFDLVLYPLLGKIGLLKTPLQRMCTGGFFIAFSFVLGGLLFKEIEKESPVLPPAGHVDLMIINAHDCIIDIQIGKTINTLPPFKHLKLAEIPGTDSSFTVVPKAGCPSTSVEELTLKLHSATAYSVVLSFKPDGNMSVTYAKQTRERSPASNTIMRFIYLGDLPFPNALLMVTSSIGTDALNITDNFTPTFELVPKANHDLCWAEKIGNLTECRGKKLSTLNLYKGAIVDTLLIYDIKTETATLKMMFAFPEDHIPIMYQFPQYFCITVGEVLLEVTSLSFNYSEAPITMKAVVTALWLLTTSIGHFLVVLVVQIKKEAGIVKESTTFFWFAGIMTVDMLIFSFLCHRYEYKKHVFAEE